jgi:hypothetical protein
MRGFNHQLSNLCGNCEILEAMISFFFFFFFFFLVFIEFCFFVFLFFLYFHLERNLLLSIIIFRVYSNLNKSLNETKERQ